MWNHPVANETHNNNNRQDQERQPWKPTEPMAALARHISKRWRYPTQV
jgi:hypothetical protein